MCFVRQFRSHCFLDHTVELNIVALPKACVNRHNVIISLLTTITHGSKWRYDVAGRLTAYNDYILFRYITPAVMFGAWNDGYPMRPDPELMLASMTLFNVPLPEQAQL